MKSTNNDKLNVTLRNDTLARLTTHRAIANMRANSFPTIGIHRPQVTHYCLVSIDVTRAHRGNCN